MVWLEVKPSAEEIKHRDQKNKKIKKLLAYRKKLIELRMLLKKAEAKSGVIETCLPHDL